MEKTVEVAIKASIKNNISYLTLYTFSTENWRRPKQEINFLFNLIRKSIKKNLKKVISQGIKINVIGKRKINNIKLTTSPYPGFPTDLQAQLMVLLCKANGISEIKEKVFENRFMHASELNRMGAKIKILGNRAVIDGNINFNPAELMATDLRASVSLVLAALIAKGKSIINRIYHIERGYEQIEKKLSKVGANIRRIS